MKTKEYLDKYNLHKGWNTKIQNEFIADMASELEAQCILNKAEDNIRGFDNALRQVRTKWDNISKKIPYGIPEKLWSYFFATVVAPFREEMCPKEMKRRADIREQKHKEYEERKRMHDDFINEMYEQMYKERLNFFKRLLANSFFGACPKDSFVYMGLETTATEDEVISKFRELALKMHPDRGGSQEAFTNLVSHKNNCLKWAGTHNIK